MGLGLAKACDLFLEAQFLLLHIGNLQGIRRRAALCLLYLGRESLVLAAQFLQPLHGEAVGQHWTTSLVFDIGVYLVVMGGILALVFALEEEL